MSKDPERQISMPIEGKPNHIERMYGKIALEHGKLMQAQRLAKIGNGQMQLNAAAMLLSLEASVAFLAEEMLRLKEKMEAKVED